VVTLNQRLRKKRILKKSKSKTPALSKNPQKKGYCLKVFTLTPKKPNSAIRKVARVVLSNDQRVTAYIPGELHTVQKHSVVLIRGGNTRDLPGVKYKIIRGKFDVTPVVLRKCKRSKYGVKKPKP
jgi:small subunit ribosomal protein S12